MPEVPAPVPAPLEGPLPPAPEVPATEGVPERRRSTLADRVCLGGIGLHITVRGVAGFFTAYLLARPVLHLLVTSSTTALISAGALARVGRLSLWVVVVAALFGLAAADVLYWWAGRRYRHRLNRDLVTLFNLPERRVLQAERLMGRWGFPLLLVRYFQPIPNFVLQLFAGAGGMGLPAYLVSSVVGAFLWMGALVGAGWAAGESAVRVVDAISANALKVTLVLVVVMVAWNVFRSRSRSRS